MKDANAYLNLTTSHFLNHFETVLFLQLSDRIGHGSTFSHFGVCGYEAFIMFAGSGELSKPCYLSN